MPSRGRPEKFQEAITTARDLADTPPIIAVRLDDNDPTDYDLTGCISVRGERGTLGRAFDEAALACVEAGADYVMMAADDLRWRTPSWDTIIEETFTRPIELVYGRDGIHDEKLATHGFVTRQWVETVGFIPHGLHGDYPDVWLMELAETLDVATYQPAVYIEHVHPFAKKAETDATYQERPSPREAAKRFASVKQVRFAATVEQLREVVDSHSLSRLST